MMRLPIRYKNKAVIAVAIGLTVGKGRKRTMKLKDKNVRESLKEHKSIRALLPYLENESPYNRRLLQYIYI